MSTLTMPERAGVPVDRPVAASLDPSSSLAARLAARIVHALSLRRAERELARLDDRMLRDIGLERYVIGYAARAGRDLAGE